jgi:hypothetical protein
MKDDEQVNIIPSKIGMRNTSTPTNIDNTDESSTTSDNKPSSWKPPSDHLKRQRMSHESFEYETTSINESKNKMKIETESAKERRR